MHTAFIAKPPSKKEVIWTTFAMVLKTIGVLMKKRNGMNDQFTISNRKFKIERNGENEKIVLTAFAA